MPSSSSSSLLLNQAADLVVLLLSGQPRIEHASDDSASQQLARLLERLKGGPPLLHLSVALALPPLASDLLLCSANLLEAEPGYAMLLRRAACLSGAAVLRQAVVEADAADASCWADVAVGLASHSTGARFMAVPLAEGSWDAGDKQACLGALLLGSTAGEELLEAPLQIGLKLAQVLAQRQARELQQPADLVAQVLLPPPLLPLSGVGGSKKYKDSGDSSDGSAGVGGAGRSGRGLSLRASMSWGSLWEGQDWLTLRFKDGAMERRFAAWNDLAMRKVSREN